MKLTQQRKVYIAVLGSAASLWAADRFILGGGPESASASALPTSVASTPVSAGEHGAAAHTAFKGSAVGPARANSTPATPLADRLTALAASFKAGDEAPISAFDEPEWMRPAPTPTPLAARVALGPSAQELFARDHQLTGVVLAASPQKTMAIVDGQSLRIGEMLGAFRLVGVTDDAATFMDGKGLVRLAVRESTHAE
ncbi:hypothetical protein BH11PLA1_BH11PLA1_12180 [soil metagenome]